jgi:hypothetical protein
MAAKNLALSAGLTALLVPIVLQAYQLWCSIMLSSEKNSWLYTVCMVRDVNRETWVDVPCNQEVTMTVLPLLRKRNKQQRKRNWCRLKELATATMNVTVLNGGGD